MFRHSTEFTAAVTRVGVTGVRVGMEPSACGCFLQLVHCQRWIRKRTNFYKLYVFFRVISISLGNFYKFIIQIISSFSESVHIFSLLSFVNGKIDQDYKKNPPCLRI
jgi:hypothetical protein